MITGKVMYNIGMIFRAVWPDGDAPEALTEMAQSKPVSAIGLISKRQEYKDADQDVLSHLFNKLPADIADPKNGVPVETSGSFWIGYYHWASALNQAAEYGSNELRQCGEALYGDTWQSNLARELGLSDARRVRQWLSGDRPIPAWVWHDIAELLAHKKIITGVALKSLIGK